MWSRKNRFTKKPKERAAYEEIEGWFDEELREILY